jgi:hypothetical protein
VQCPTRRLDGDFERDSRYFAILPTDYNVALMDCPNCKLLNPPTATRCDCGYDFQTHTVQKSYLTERDKQLSRTGAGVAGAILVAFFVLRLTGAAIAKHSLPLCIVTVIVAAVFVGLWFRNRNTAL